GDPNQLPQVSQGAQRKEVRASVLEHLLGEATTITDDRGIFLAETWRLRPELCDFISRTFYDGRTVPGGGGRSSELGGGQRLEVPICGACGESPELGGGSSADP